LVATNQYSEGPVDEVIENLLEWPHGAMFEPRSEGLSLNVKAVYLPDSEDDEEL
jgi:hypothetical protein